MTTDYTPSPLAEDLALALRWEQRSRFEIGAMMVRLRAAEGEDIMRQAVPEGKGTLANWCLGVAERWPNAEALAGELGLQFGHFRRCLKLDDAAADAALAKARADGLTPAMLGKWLHGLDPFEPSVAGMALALADGEDLILRPYDGGWYVTLEDGWVGPWAESIGAAIRAAYRQRFGGKGEGQS